MREILFRGKRIDNGEWVYGYYVHLNYAHFFQSEHLITDKEASVSYVVDPETVGLFTSLTDKNGKKIFEGNIWELHGVRGIIKWSKDDACFVLAYKTNDTEYTDPIFTERAKRLKIIGNIYDNPELLKGEENDSERP